MAGYACSCLAFNGTMQIIGSKRVMNLCIESEDETYTLTFKVRARLCLFFRLWYSVGVDVDDLRPTSISSLLDANWFCPSFSIDLRKQVNPALGPPACKDSVS